MKNTSEHPGGALWQYNDGGRSEAGFRGETNDCVTRAIAIASGEPYRDVYERIREAAARWSASSRSAKARRLQRRGPSPRNGVPREVYEPLLLADGWAWTFTMGIGQGCSVHLRGDELPSGRLIVRCSKHLVAVIDGIVHDTYDCSRGGTRCVYGFFRKTEGSDD